MAINRFYILTKLMKGEIRVKGTNISGGKIL